MYVIDYRVLQCDGGYDYVHRWVPACIHKCSIDAQIIESVCRHDPMSHLMECYMNIQIAVAIRNCV